MKAFEMSLPRLKPGVAERGFPFCFEGTGIYDPERSARASQVAQ